LTLAHAPCMAPYCLVSVKSRGLGAENPYFHWLFCITHAKYAQSKGFSDTDVQKTLIL